MAGKDGFVAARFGFLHLPVPTVAGACAYSRCISQEITALVSSWEKICISDGHRGEHCVVDTERRFSVILRSKHHRTCLVQQFGLYQIISTHSVSLFSFVLSCIIPGSIRVLKHLREVCSKMDVLLDSGDLAQPPVLHTRELG